MTRRSGKPTPPPPPSGRHLCGSCDKWHAGQCAPEDPTPRLPAAEAQELGKLKDAALRCGIEQRVLDRMEARQGQAGLLDTLREATVAARIKRSRDDEDEVGGWCPACRTHGACEHGA